MLYFHGMKKVSSFLMDLWMKIYLGPKKMLIPMCMQWNLNCISYEQSHYYCEISEQKIFSTERDAAPL